MADEQVPGFEPGETPSFGDAVKAFTPPGTDFDEFKKALHSQGAPGAISPDMVAMLNKASAAGAIPGGPVAQSGTTCARCDHPHGGPPGKTCLEAEAHLGRSPLRRRPDLHLDAISSPGTAVVAPFGGPDFPQGMPTVFAVGASEMAWDLMRAGLTEDQALRLTAYIINAHNTSTDT